MQSASIDNEFDEAAPERLARMIVQTSDDDTGGSWGPQELSAILRHRLSLALSSESSIAAGATDTDWCALTGSESFGDLLCHPNPPPQLLQKVLRFAQTSRHDPESSLPAEVATVLFYAAAAALIRSGQRVEDVDEMVLFRGLSWAAGQDWVDAGILALLRDARDRMSSSGVPANSSEWDAVVLPPVPTLDDFRTQVPGAPAFPSVPGYRVGSQLGEGGMATVWRAVQLSTKRQVALKILNGGSGSPRQQMRFEREVELAAKLEHPSIAHVYDSGSFGERFFYAMELVDGVPLDQYVKQPQPRAAVPQAKLSTREILELMRDVCLAVQHAHQRGVIHRDLKPSNILVTPEGRPKVLDFGLAKALGESNPDLTLTHDGQVAGTPAFMSPEQASGQLDKLDVRSDVYSLGATLYLLLTGHHAHDLGGPRYEALRRIAHEEVRRPRLMNEELDDELDALLLKALDRDPDRRYGSAGELAQDIGRYLKAEPLAAAPPSTAYRLRKFARKHRLALGIAAAFMLLLLGAVVISSWQALRLARSRDAEAAQRKQAEAVAQLLESVFRRLDPNFAQKGGDDLKTQLVAQLDRVAANLDKDYPNDPLTRARLRSILGNTEVGLGEIAKGDAMLRAALNEQMSYGNPDDLQTLITMNSLANAWDEAGRYGEAIALFEQVRDRSIRSLGRNHRSTLNTIDDLAVAYNHAGQYPQAIALQEAVRDRKISNLGIDHPDTLVALNNLGSAYMSAGRFNDAIKTFEEARDRETKVLGPDHALTLIALNNLALAFENAGRVPEAIALGERVRDQETRNFGLDHPRTLLTIMNLGAAYKNAGRSKEAIALLEPAREKFVKTFGPDHPNTLKLLNNLADAYQADGRTADAIELFEKGAAAAVKVLGPDHPITLVTRWEWADLYQRQAQYAKAEPLWLALGNWSLAHPQGLPGYGISAGKVLPKLIACYRAMNETTKAEQWAAKLEKIAPQMDPSSAPPR